MPSRTSLRCWWVFAPLARVSSTVVMSSSRIVVLLPAGLGPIFPPILGLGSPRAPIIWYEYWHHNFCYQAQQQA
jgi:hypothetical protein